MGLDRRTGRNSWGTDGRAAYCLQTLLLGHPPYREACSYSESSLDGRSVIFFVRLPGM